MADIERVIELVNPQRLELHPDAGEVLMMSADQYKEFLKAVKADGRIREPLKRIKGTNTIIDGRHRRQAAIDAGFPVVPVVDEDLAGEDPVLYMLSSATYRRHFTPGQRSAQGAKYLKRLRELAKQRQREGAKKGGQLAGKGRPKGPAAAAPAEQPKPAPKSRDEAARLSGSNPKAVVAAEKIQQKAPEVFDKLAAGEIELPEAKRLAGIATKKKEPSKEDPGDGTRLMKIPNFPSDALVRLIENHIFTVEDLDAYTRKLAEQVGRRDVSRYGALRELGLAEDLVMKVGQVLDGNFKPGKAKPAAPVPPIAAVQLDTLLSALLHGDDVIERIQALHRWKQGVTVKDLITKFCTAAPPLGSYTSTLGAYLRGIPDLGSPAANQILDALIDAGFVTGAGPVTEPKPAAPDAHKPAPMPGPLDPTEKAGVGSSSHSPLEPCPFCGSADVMVVFGFALKKNQRTPVEYVRCKGCGCIGPKAADKATLDQVRKQWNKRAPVAGKEKS